MKAVLPHLMVVLLWAVCARADVAVQPDFDLHQFAGMWQIMAGASNCPVFQSMRDKMQSSAAIVTALPDGDMRILTGFPSPEKCKKVDRVYKKTEHPGRFTYADETGKRDTRVMETDYTSYAFLYTFKEAEGEPSTTSIQIYNFWCEIKEPPPSALLLKTRLRWFGYVVRMDNSRTVHQVYSSQGIGKRSRARSPDISPEVMEKFKQHCHNVGLTDDLTVMLPKSDMCVKALSG